MKNEFLLRNPHSRWKAGLLLILLGLPVFAGSADETTGQATAGATDDESAPLEVNADSFEADRASGISVFTGNVTVRKGSLDVRADEVRIRAVDGEAREGTLIGDPVTFVQEPADAPPVRGEARRIEYDAVNEIVVLTGNAWVTQGDDRFEGESIRYDLSRRKVIARSSETTPERVKIVFQPRKEPPAEEQPDMTNPDKATADEAGPDPVKDEPAEENDPGEDTGELE